MYRDARFAFVGRAFLAILFFVAGLGKVASWGATSAYMTSHGVPAVSFLLGVAAVIELAGAGMLLLGIRVRTAAAVLFLYLIPVTLVFHGYWSYEGAERQAQLINFLKNLGIMGGLLNVYAYGAGAAAAGRRTGAVEVPSLRRAG